MKILLSWGCTGVQGKLEWDDGGGQGVKQQLRQPACGICAGGQHAAGFTLPQRCFLLRLRHH